jgi:hypothetical protein
MLRVLDCLSGDDLAALVDAVRACHDLNERLDDGESVLFQAVLSGRVEFVRAVLDGGADPNFHAAEPATDMLAPTPLDLAKQLRFLIDWDVYHSIVRLLESRGESDSGGQIDSTEQLEVIESRARVWQARRA